MLVRKSAHAEARSSARPALTMLLPGPARLRSTATTRAAFGVGPVLRGSAGLQWNQHTGQASWYGSIGVGYGAALIAGLGGAMSNQERTTGYGKTDNAQLALGGRLSISHSGKETAIQGSAGPQIGAELSKTENVTKTGKIAVTDKGRCP